MKRFLSIFICVLMISGSLFLYGCDGGEEAVEESNASVTDIMDRIVSEFPEIPTQKALYVDGVSEDDEGYIDPEYACYIYTGEYDEFPQMDKLENYAIRLPDGKSAFEIHIFKVKDEADIDEIKEILAQRIEMLRNSDIELYDPEGFKMVMGTAEVYTVGKYAYLLITSDNAAAKTAIEAAMFPADA